MNITGIRVATNEELPKIIEFLKRPEVDNMFVIPLSLRAKTFEDRVYSVVENGKWVVAMAEDGEVYGCWSAKFDVETRSITFSTLAIHPSLHGQGIGERVFF